MSLFFTLAYAIGYRPWETAASRAAERIEGLFDREERERQRPYGPALDVGCGTGIQAVELAQRGWQVTGIDNVPKALRAAEERAHKAGVEVRFINGDVTALRAAGVGNGIRFVLDFGCFHGLTDEQREAMGREVTAVTEPGATLLMIAWAPGRRWLLPRGADRADIERAFPAWTTIAEEAVPVTTVPAALKETAPRFYRLRRD